ncbi:hypothetical protein Drose_06540 [Dactylosporangium roseum]|uniref:Uncharacterized protein n=1 Tax=Dactylosporangium roseum TaxID=47989 RepID=A0ABY5Z7C3_9ACTN|nr:hypothetical protein [Dactylosporangium roseum]UWZ37931.1 hypothetical protein Drose_06540 [Dactylosporangium roseum]
MSLMDATTVDLSPWAVRFRQRHAKPVRRDDYSWDHHVARVLLTVLFGVARFVVAAVIDLAIYAVVFVVVLVVASTAVEFFLWRR